jgi:3-hydroxyisobutyrate dehydrogenase
MPATHTVPDACARLPRAALVILRCSPPPCQPTLSGDPSMPATAALSLGFIGLGVMGAPMAGHLAAAGHRLALLDADAGVASAVAARLGGGAQVAATPAAVAAQSDIVITMLPDGGVVQQVALGDQGLVQGLRPGALLLDCSSAEPWRTQATAAALAARGVAMVDAPVSGAAGGAAEANLVFMVGGAAADVARVQALLALMGRAVFHLGGVGSGHAMKSINNLITALTFGATAEGLVIGKRYGLDPAAMVDVLNASTGQSWITQNHIRQRILSRSFDDPFKLALMHKDVGIANALARETGTAAPLAGLGQQLWQAAARAAGPEASVSELVRCVEALSGTAITPGAGPRQGAG